MENANHQNDQSIADSDDSQDVTLDEVHDEPISDEETMHELTLNLPEGYEVLRRVTVTLPIEIDEEEVTLYHLIRNEPLIPELDADGRYPEHLDRTATPIEWESDPSENIYDQLNYHPAYLPRESGYSSDEEDSQLY